MTRITLDSATSAKLTGVGQHAELCDDAGRTLGYFVPVVVPSKYAGMDSPLGEEELKRRAKQRSGRTLAEIMADLEKRA